MMLNCICPLTQILPVLCVDEVKSWMAANFLSLKESKTEVIIFGPSEMSDTAGINLGTLSPSLPNERPISLCQN